MKLNFRFEIFNECFMIILNCHTLHAKFFAIPIYIAKVMSFFQFITNASILNVFIYFWLNRLIPP